MSDLIERAKAALEGVTEGPWDIVPGANGNVWHFPEEGTPTLVVTMGRMTEANAEFIAAARTLVPELVAALEAAQAKCAANYAEFCEIRGGLVAELVSEQRKNERLREATTSADSILSLLHTAESLIVNGIARTSRRHPKYLSVYAMTDVRAQLAAVLREHERLRWSSYDDPHFPYRCPPKCGKQFKNDQQHLDHLADVLLAGPVGELQAENERLRNRCQAYGRPCGAK